MIMVLTKYMEVKAVLCGSSSYQFKYLGVLAIYYSSFIFHHFKHPDQLVRYMGYMETENDCFHPYDLTSIYVILYLNTNPNCAYS